MTGKRLLRYSPPVAVALILLGAFLFDVPGLGTGNNESGQSPERAAQDVRVSLDSSAGGSLGRSAEKGEPVAAERVEVVIDDRQYRVVEDEDKLESAPVMTLEEVAEKVKQASGDDNGIRIRIRRKKNSRFTAEEQLRDVLEDAGISKDSQLWSDELIP